MKEKLYSKLIYLRDDSNCLFKNSDIEILLHPDLTKIEYIWDGKKFKSIKSFQRGLDKELTEMYTELGGEG